MNAKAEVKKICDRRYGKGKYEMRENPEALDAAGKVERRELRTAARAEKTAAEEALRKLPRADKMLAELADAAQFVVDVTGDSPSIPNLAGMLALVRDWQAADERFKDAAATFRKLDGCGYLYRCEVSNYDFSGPLSLSIQQAAGDTWAEVLEKLTAKSKPSMNMTATTSG